MNVGSATQALDLLKEHEKVIARLYSAYAERFPQEREFWQGLSEEERLHAGWLESLQSDIANDPRGLIVNRYPQAAVEHSIRYINKLINHAVDPNLTRVKALSAAMDIENALLENRYFEVFASDNPAIQRTLECLDRGTRVHLQRVRQLWQDAAQSQKAMTHPPETAKL